MEVEVEAKDPRTKDLQQEAVDWLLEGQHLLEVVRIAKEQGQADKEVDLDKEQGQVDKEVDLDKEQCQVDKEVDLDNEEGADQTQQTLEENNSKEEILEGEEEHLTVEKEEKKEIRTTSKMQPMLKITHNQMILKQDSLMVGRLSSSLQSSFTSPLPARLQ